MEEDEAQSAKRARTTEDALEETSRSSADTASRDKERDRRSRVREKAFLFREEKLRKQEDAVQEKKTALENLKEEQERKRDISYRRIRALEEEIKTILEELDQEIRIREEKEKDIATEEEELRVKRAELEEDRMRKQEEGVVIYTRSCTICSVESPIQRSVFVGCGHLTCRACAETLAMNAHPLLPLCPFCRKASAIVRYLEYTNLDWTGMEGLEAAENEKERKEAEEWRLRVPPPICTVQENSCFCSEGWVERRRLIVDAYLRQEIDERQYEERYNFKLEAEAIHRATRGGTRQDVLVEEYNRLNLPLPKRIPYDGPSIDRLAECAVLARRKEDKLRLVKKLQRLNELNSQCEREYSRECGICNEESPKQRAVFTACGHSVCSSCLALLRAMETHQQEVVFCPCCHIPTYTVNLFEQVV